jgi:hypothetical protein
MKFAVCFALIFSVTFASVVKRQAPEEAAAPRAAAPAAPAAQGVYVLPDGAELVVGSIQGGFTCADKIYGYYADTANDCKLFHICVPTQDAEGNQQPIIYSFFCGNQTVFDQQYLVCASLDSATPCSEAQNFYSVNDNFGRTDVPFLPDRT